MDRSDLFDNVGGSAGCRKLAEAFYARVARDPVLRPLFPGKTFRCAIEEFSAFLTQFLGGPLEDTQHRWWLSLRESHLRFRIGQEERDAWMKNMTATLNDAQIADSARSALQSLFEQSSAYLVNVGENPTVANDTDHEEISRRWRAQRNLDDAVSAIREGDTNRAIALAQQCSRPVLAGLLALMIVSGDEHLLQYVREKLSTDPTLPSERYSGRTLLHAAAAIGNLNIVELLLKLGVNPNTTDDGGHTPLYSLANECKASSGPDVTRALIRGGANVNASDGVKHCTALHMAARRGHVEIAKALLDSGAAIEAKDTSGDTALRRAVNCEKQEVAKLLISRGADIHSRGSKRLTPATAARSGAMRLLVATTRSGAPR